MHVFPLSRSSHSSTTCCTSGFDLAMHLSSALTNGLQMRVRVVEQPGIQRDLVLRNGQALDRPVGERLLHHGGFLGDLGIAPSVVSKPIARTSA